MSTYYAVSCHDCKDSGPRAFNHAEDRAKAVVGVLLCIINVEQADPWGLFEVEFGDTDGRDFYEFAKTHRHHRLEVVDEYSRYPEPKIDVSHRH